MLNLKKAAAVVILTLANSAVFAANTGTSWVPDRITIPREQCAWSFNLAALYLQASFGGNGLGYSSFSNYGTDFFGNQREVNGASNRLSNFQPKRDFGFQIGGSYDFKTRNDVSLNWYHFNNNTGGRLPQGTLFAGSASTLYAGYIKVSPSWDAVNLEVGQHFDFNGMHMLRIHGGVEYARVKNTFTNYPQLFPTGSPVFITTDSISYTGFGPRIGGDFTYDLCRSGFGLYVNAAGSLLAGSAKQTVSGYRDLSGFNLYSTGNYTQTNNSVVVPELEAMLGLKYNYQITKSNLGFDLGYMWVSYVGALVSQVGSGVVSSSISNSTSTSFNLNGPYLRFTWSGNV